LSVLLQSRATVWLPNASQGTFTSPTLSKTVKLNVGILGAVYAKPMIANILRPSQHHAYDQLVDFPELSSMYIPLLADDDNVFCMAQIVRDSGGLPFSDVDETNANFFAKKFHQVSHLIASSHPPASIVTNLNDSVTPALVAQIAERLMHNFRCRDVEFWLLEKSTAEISKYLAPNFVPQPLDSVGAVSAALKSGVTVNVVDVSKCAGYLAAVDGKPGASLLVVPFVMPSQIFGCVLRGKLGRTSFSNMDAIHLENMTPLISKSIISKGISNEEALKSSGFSLRLQALLEVAEILTGVLDIDALVPIIMERACSLLNTERCSIFLVDQNRTELITRFHGGLAKSIRIPISRGIVGHTATTGEVVNIVDAYADARFDKQVDMETGFRTRTLLSVPIYNNRGEIAGVTEMINRRDGSSFDDGDIKMMMAFNVFCGISLDNAKLYTTSLNLSRQLQGFAEMGSTLNASKTVKDILEEILNNSKLLINASRATIFLRDVDADTITEHINLGDRVEHGTIFAREVVSVMKPKAFSRDEVSAQVSGQKAIPRSTSSYIVPDAGNDDENPLFDPICDFPLLTSDSQILGVMELKCNWKILPEDVKLLDCFAVFAAVSLEKSTLEQIAKVGHIEVQLKKWISDEERPGYAIPQKLVIPPAKREGIFTVYFDAPQWDGIGLFKVLFCIMDTFQLFSEFNISSELFFTFISEISATYNKVPYHNWRHACDVSQFVCYETKLAKMDSVLTKRELLGLCVASICHDANHDGFTNVFNEKAETPLGILFKNQSVMETHHCTVSIGIMTKEHSNLFHSLQGAEYNKMWTLIIQLILITDMAKHFGFLNTMGAELDKGPLDLENDEHRLMLMQVILKCGDISNVSRPFELADKWCDVLCEEFFRQGDLEMANGMEYTSPLNDREHLDKPKSQIGFYTFVCLPLYQLAARALPPLQANVDQVESNLATWKAAAAAVAAKEAVAPK
jgi:putative methionine-R-sulfoxide reductase with GAF domain